MIKASYLAQRGTTHLGRLHPRGLWCGARFPVILCRDELRAWPRFPDRTKLARWPRSGGLPIHRKVAKHSVRSPTFIGEGFTP